MKYVDIMIREAKEILVLSHIPTPCNGFCAGDFNGHSPLWDNSQPTDSRGTRIEEWIADSNLTCANDGSPTRTNRGTGGCIAPDIFLAPSSWMDNVEWSV
jgi:hypothetical protein